MVCNLGIMCCDDFVEEKMKMGDALDREMSEFTELADELSKRKYTGAVRLRFQAAFKMAANEWAIAVKHSQPVHDAS